MSETVIKVENLSKQYRLGTVGTGTLSHDLNRWWHRVRGKADPYLKVTDTNDRTQQTDSDYVWALRDINFEVKRGEVLGIIGRNGAGKSTLLKILARVTAPTEGTVKIKGRIGSLLEVGTGFHPELTGRENVYLNGAILGMTKTEVTTKLDEIVDFSGCERYLDTPVKRYSSGMLVRLAFSVAAHLDPEILIVDEVLAVGDAEFQKKCMGRMAEVAREGRTVLFVSHNMEAVLNLCTATTVIDEGRNTNVMPTDEALRIYRNMAAPAKVNRDTEKTARKSTSSVFRSLTVVGANGIYGATPVGDALDCRLVLQGLEAQRSVECALVISSRLGQRVALFHTKYHSDLSVKGQPCLELHCRIPALPLVPDTYSMGVVVGNGYEIIESIDTAADLEVLPCDYLGTGNLPSSKQGYVVLPCRWELEPHGA